MILDWTLPLTGLLLAVTGCYWLILYGADPEQFLPGGPVAVVVVVIL